MIDFSNTLSDLKEKTLKFFGVGSAPLLTDLLTSNLIHYLLDWSLTLSGLIGFLAGTVMAYFLYLYITFAERELDFSWKSLYRFLKSSLLAAIIRVASLSVLEWTTNWFGFVIFALSIALSGICRYCLAHFYVFKKMDEEPDNIRETLARTSD
ncbi:MAG TPA: GtrA family protein [Alphaproteobacteria bacterium]|nr:GtrA family protein [Alphaproteobacteria bacterium]HOO51997.1 GtrA family protein [Alphaproteobacteria bacterium]